MPTFTSIKKFNIKNIIETVKGNKKNNSANISQSPMIDEVKTRKEEEEKKRAEQQKRREEQQKKREEEEKKRREEQQKKREEEEKKRREEQQKKREEEEKKRRAEQQKRKEEEKQNESPEEQKWREEERKWREEERMNGEKRRKRREEEQKRQEEEQRRQKEEQKERQKKFVEMYHQIAEKDLLKAITRFQKRYEYNINDFSCTSEDDFVIYNNCEYECNVLFSILEKNGIDIFGLNYYFKRAYFETEYDKINFIEKKENYSFEDYLILIWQCFSMDRYEYDLKMLRSLLGWSQGNIKFGNIDEIGNFNMFKDEILEICKLYHQYFNSVTMSDEINNFPQNWDILRDNAPPKSIDDILLGMNKLNKHSSQTRDYFTFRSILFCVKFRELGYFSQDKIQNMQLLEDGFAKININVIAEIENNLLNDAEEQDILVTIEDIDQMDGYIFERFLANLYINMGYNVRNTKLSGDQGADLIISRNGESYAIQAKKYSGKVTNKAVQEVSAAIKYYNADGGIVVTNSEFTESAVLLAYSNDISLINREKLINLIEKYPVKKEA